MALLFKVIFVMDAGPCFANTTCNVFVGSCMTSCSIERVFCYKLTKKKLQTFQIVIVVLSGLQSRPKNQC